MDSYLSKTKQCLLPEPPPADFSFGIPPWNSPPSPPGAPPPKPPPPPPAPPEAPPPLGSEKQTHYDLLFKYTIELYMSYF